MATDRNPYLRREFEPLERWAERLLECPILGPESFETISSISGADHEFLIIVANKMKRDGWTSPRKLGDETPLLRVGESVEEALMRIEGGPDDAGY